jgi:iron complex outermembrane receptor protein
MSLRDWAHAGRRRREAETPDLSNFETMKTKQHRTPKIYYATLALSAAMAMPSAFAQSGGAKSPTGQDEVIQLTPFSVSARQVGRYSSSEATSGTRVATDLFTSPQSLVVITREAFDDTGASRILDVARYASGITESTIPGGLDRTTIRGFQVEGQTIDGFYAGAQANVDPVFVERLEIVKGPNAILAPAGVPGGTINQITRKPLFKNSGSVAASYGRYDGYRGEFDVNRSTSVGGNDVAFRVVGAATDIRDGWRGTTGHSVGVMPEALLRTKTGAELLLQFQAFTWRAQNDLGIPADPSSGTTNDAKLLSGVSRELNISDNDYRLERRLEARSLFTAPITDQLSMRVALRYTHLNRDFTQFIPSGSNGGDYDPRTGNFVPGSIFTVNPADGTITVSPAAVPSRIMNRGAQFAPETHEYFDFQHDYAHKLDVAGAHFTTVGGVAFAYIKQTALNYVGSKPAINFDAPAPATYVIGAQNSKASAVSAAEQAYVMEKTTFLDDRVTLNGGLTYYNNDLKNHDPFQSLPHATASADTMLKSYGVAISPVKFVSVYYGYNENASVNLAPSTVQQIAKGAPALQFGRQHEYGLRLQSTDHQYYLTVAHFDIHQNNYGIPNPGNLVIPQPSPLLPNLFTDRIAKGWEIEARAAITTQLSLMGNWTHFTNRDQNNVPFRGTAETSAALLANYDLSKIAGVKGLSIGLGADYRGRTPGDQASGYTAFPFLVPKQPTFYLPARTLVNLMVSYKATPNLRIQLIVNNVLNKEYLQSSINRFNVYPGRPFDPELRATYTF